MRSSTSSAETTGVRPGLDQLPAHLDAGLERVGAPGVRDHQDVALVAHRGPLGRRTRIQGRASIAPPHSVGLPPTLADSQTRYSWLPLRADHWGGDDARRRQPEIPRRPEHAAHGVVPRGAIAHDTLADPGAPDLELRLDQQHEVGAESRPSRRARAGRGQRDERDVRDDEVGHLRGARLVASALGRQLPRVDPLDDPHPRIVARIGGASWPCPTSSAITSRAPRSSSTWVNPPVDAPTSRARRPVDDRRRTRRAPRELAGRPADLAIVAVEAEHGIRRHPQRRLERRRDRRR